MWVIAQGCKLDAVLVLRIQNGNDIFLSVTGTYAPSFFGVSLPSLASLPRCVCRAEHACGRYAYGSPSAEPPCSV